MVALLAEGVDRNWQSTTCSCELTPVALLAEGVDRNWIGFRKYLSSGRRPPRGGRG